MCNYKSISALPSFGKLLENVVELQLIYFLESNSLLSSSHIGFRKGVSTEHARHSMVKDINDHFIFNEYVIGRFFDFL